MNENLKLFVWEEVEVCFGVGLAIALAKSKEDAIRLVRKKEQRSWMDRFGGESMPPHLVDLMNNIDRELLEKLYKKEPRLIETEEAFVIWEKNR